MPQVTIKLDETEEKIVNVLKTLKGYKSKEKAIKNIINEYGNRIEIKEIIEKMKGK
ncbi:MAG: DUF2683 family protein [Candidatus Methanoperedens sp.]|nr:DUF2683 family protein [Candidatus Methanoperedens sp.]